MTTLTSQSALGRFATRHGTSIIFIIVALCVGGVYAALRMPSSIFPQTNFPRVIIIMQNGVMPADEMMATITRPVEEAMKDIPGSQTIRSSTGRGTAEIDVFFSWDVDMVQSELYVLSRISQIRSTLPPTATADVHRMTFSAFPIIGLSLTSDKRDQSNLWEIAQYSLKPRLLRMNGVASIEILGGRPPEYQVTVDPLRLAALKLSLAQVTDALNRNNLVAPTGMHDEDHRWYLTVVDGRVHSIPDIENLPVMPAGGTPVLIKDFARVERAPEPQFNVVTADGKPAVLLNIYSQPDGSTVEIADSLRAQLNGLAKEVPSDIKTSFFYDQSLFVRASARSAWEAIIFGLILSIVILYLFLRNWGTTLVATIVIPVTVLITIIVLKLGGQSFNLMSLGGIAAAIGLIIDDAIVVVESIHARMSAGLPRAQAVQAGIGEIFAPLIGSTLTPVVVFIPLAFLTGIAGVFFRALAITMVAALLTSLLLALTLTPSLAGWLIGLPSPEQEGGFIMRWIIARYQAIVRLSLQYRWLTVGLCLLVLSASATLFGRLKTDFLPSMDEGGFVIDYIAPAGTSLSESNRQMLRAEEVLKKIPEIESYSRRTGAALGVHLVEPNTGDFLVKLKPDRTRGTDAVIADVRKQFRTALPAIQWDFPGILTDLVGDLTSWSDSPIEIKLYSSDLDFLTNTAPDIEDQISKIHGVVDTDPGVVYTGPSINLRVRYADAERYGLSAESIAAAVNTAMLGQTASTVLEADRVINIRVKVDPAAIDQIAKLREMPMKTPNGTIIRLDQVVDLSETPGQLELERDDLRQMVAITARLQDRDMGSAMKEVRNIIDHDPVIPPGSVEYGGLYEQQQQSFANLVVVLVMAFVLVFAVAVIEFRSLLEPVAIVFGAVLALFGIVVALLITGTSLNIVTYLGAIIGVGIVHKNGILMLDYVSHLRGTGMGLVDAIVESGRRRLRPVLMTSMAAALGMLPLAYGIGSGADMLKPLAVAVIGAVCVSVLFSLIATPTAYYLLLRLRGRE